MSITHAINLLCDRYLEVYGLIPMQINNGQCEDFATDLEHFEYEVSVWGDEDWINWSDNIEDYPDWFSHFAGGHCFTWYKNKYYDSECSEGCEFADQLPYYQRQKKWINSLKKQEREMIGITNKVR